MLQLAKLSARNRWLQITAFTLFLIASLMLARFIYIFPFSLSYDWAQASTPLLIIIIVAALAFFIYVTLVWSLTQAVILFILTISISSFGELWGLQNGYLFGDLYHYNPDIEPRIANALPIVIPLAWFIFSCIPLVLMRPWLVEKRFDHRGDTSTTKPISRLFYITFSKQVFFCALILTSCDFYLEPLSLYTNSWAWNQQGLYYGAPVSNFFGWFIIGIIIYSLFFYLQHRWHKPDRLSHRSLDTFLIGLFMVWVIVALVIIADRLDSILPLCLTVMILAPSIYLRRIKISQSRESIPVANRNWK
ncbi:MAG: carotenoid biosynthesis protein [Candidatus Thiodiazotropha sp. LLP2]